MSVDPFDTLEAVSEKLSKGEVTSLAVTEAMISRIVKLNPQIGAYSDILIESAMKEAMASDARRAKGESLGRLDGVPVAVKDLIDTVPAVCSAGLEHLKDYKPQTDAPVVQALRCAGAVILGVTESDPGGFSTETLSVQNPIRVDRIAGGSSGGSAAAVASGMAYAALGTDTGGSIRIPAACCGVFGFKPTFGRVSAEGVRPLAPTLDHIGPIARSVEDLRIIQSVIDPHFADSTEETIAGIRIAVPAGRGFAFDTSIRETMDFVVGRLKQGGIDVGHVGLPDGDDILPFHMVNLPAEAARYHLEHFPDQWPSYPPVARETVEIGMNTSAQDVENAERRRNAARSHVEALFDDTDVLIVPIMPVEAPGRGSQTYCYNGRQLSKLEATVWNTSIFNQTGHPVVALTVRHSNDVKATGLQLVGALGSDALLLKMARSLDQALASLTPHAEWLAQHQEIQNIDTSD